MNWKNARTFVILSAFLNAPLLALWSGVFIIPFMFWVNIPGLLFLNKWVGKPHYEVEAFGVMPRTSLALFFIAMFWTSLAFAITAISAYTGDIKGRFSLRTLLIVMTLVAMVLGLIAYVARG